MSGRNRGRGKGYAITKEGEPKDGWETLVFEGRETPPLELSLILSDALHNWRAALDNLASQLVRLNGGTPDENTYFPIFPNQTDFEGKRGQRRLRGMSDAHKAAIAEMQPYPGRSTPRVLALETVHTLAKRDRHRALHATFASPAHIDMLRFLKEGDGPDPIVSIQLLARGKRLEHGTPFVRLRVQTPLSHPDVKVRVEPIFEVAFGERGLRLYGIPQLGIEIGEVVRTFAPDFPD